LFFFCDFHAHHGVKNCFLIGNNLDFVMQVEARVYAKLLSINSQWVDYGVCNFAKKNMKAKDRGENLDKEGSARVSTYKLTNLPHAYTLEFGYHQNVEKGQNITNHKDLTMDPDSVNFNPSDFLKKSGDRSLIYTQKVFETIGEDILTTLLDLFEKNVYNTSVRFKMKRNLDNIRSEIALQLRKEYIRKESAMDYKITNINNLIKSSIYDKLPTFIPTE
jgi:hypothetical protein